MKIGDILDTLERFAPLSFQDSFDNAGLQVGLTKVEATGVLLCLDVTESVIDEAIGLGYNLIISHHPLIFKPVKSITGKNYVERCIMKAIQHNITIYSAHTNLDNILNGVNHKIAEMLNMRNLKVLHPSTDCLMKLVTFVPVNDFQKLQRALFAIGCGHVENYDSCSFYNEGVGTFRALEGANPYVGEVHEFHKEPEIRLETTFYSYMKDLVIRTLLENHPYEKPAYDIISLYGLDTSVGSGLVGDVECIDAVAFLNIVKEQFGVARLGYSGNLNRNIKRVAICGGAGAFLINDAMRENADVFITGEIKYHEFCGNEDKIILAEIGHYESEQFTQDLLLDFLREKLDIGNIKKTNIGTNLKKYL